MSRIAGNAKIKIVPTRMSKLRHLFLISIILVVCFFLLTSKENFYIFVDETYRINPGPSAITSDSKEWFTIDTSGCTIPAMEPLDESVKSYMVYPSGIPRCPHANHALLGSNRKKIWVRLNSLKYYRINKTEKISCCYRSFIRPTSIEDIEFTRLDNMAIYSKCIHFHDVIEVKDEFVQVKCTLGSGNIVYEQYFVFAPLKDFARKRNLKEMPHNKTAFNVLILGIDAVSRLNFHRTMPGTANFLEIKGAVEFLGYNKVGDNTFPNLVPMLMGLKATELKKTCYPYDTVTFDNCPFIWQWFKEAGYYTALGEDAPNIGTFNYAKTGFRIAPTDYYLHTFMNEASKNVGTNKDFNSFLCMHDNYFYKVLLDYIEELTWRLSNKKLFGFFWEISMSHDYLNYPMKMDDDYMKFFSRLDSSGYLSETMLVLVSDHGMRWGPIRHTKQGRLEERLPFLFILPPKSFPVTHQEAYNNLKLNSKRLTTPFDVHATISDLLDVSNLENKMIIERSKKSYGRDRSISLFLPIPGNRTCQVAEIDEHWCTCHKEVSLAKDNPQAYEAAKALVILINDMMKEYPQCAKLTISDMMDVTEIEAGEPESDEYTWMEFLVVVKTAPGDAIFEATLRQDGDDQSWKLLGTPSRLNLYGDQSRCVDNYQMKLYCYCP